MKRNRKSTALGRSAYRSLLAASLTAGGFLQVASPLFASTPAGTQISNTATATYEDPNQPGTPINTTSNRVTVTVAEVAGITVTPLATTDVNGGTVLPNDVIQYDFRITNVGNDPTQFFLPGTATLTGAATAGTLQYSTNGGTTFINIPAAGLTTASVPVDGSVIVRVPVTINALAPSGAPIAVRYGDTGTNDNSPGTQNQPYSLGPNDVYTIDNPDGTTGEAAGVPVNGQREASAIQQVLVGAQPQAFAAVLKTRTNYTDSTTPALNDDVLTYSLSLRVDATAPTGSVGLTPAGLVGTAINVDGSSVPRVLVSDAIPANTALTGSPTAPSGWQVVYTTDALTVNANAANWTITRPGGTITRVGFINAGPIAAGATVTGFQFNVVTSGVTTTQTIANIAQLFGQTQGGGTSLVYDESGDPTPSNFNDNGTPGSNTPTNGVADTTRDGVDSGNNNTGSGPGGEANVFTLSAPGTILNGPDGRPDAVGPTNNNDDFTNRSTPIAANTAPGSSIDPGSITFTNTVNNPSTSNPLSGVLLVPDDGGSANTVPTGTLVTLTYGSQTAVYEYNGTDFIFSSGNTITIPSLAAGQSINYTVAVDLPANTPLSTDLNTSRGNLPSYPVPIYAFVDVNGNGRPDGSDTTQNATINRVYTGFLRLVKEARILGPNGAELETWSLTPSSANIRPGNIIEYRITYTNISIAPVGAGNRILSATNVAIDENGTVAPNNWAAERTVNGVNVINTSNVTGSAAASNGSITYFPSGDRSGTTAATDVTRYLNNLGVIVQPQASGTFTFRRRIN